MTEPARKVVLITVDSLRADAVGLYGAPDATPAMDRLGEQGLLFANASATGPHTTQSFPGILASNYPTTGGTVQNLGSRVSVAECFRAGGFNTAGFHSNPLLSRSRGYARGFETFWDSLPLASCRWSESGGGALTRLPDVVGPISEFSARRCPALFRLARRAYRTFARRLRRVEQPYEPAEEINQRAMRWMQGAGNKFFVWIHYMDPHWPYGTTLRELSDEERKEAGDLSERALKDPERLDEYDVRRLREFYIAEVRHLDACLGQLFDFMMETGLWQEGAIFLTSDHGQAFMEHGTCLHGDLLYDELIRVPLMVKAPGLGPHVERGVASLIDLAPTLCHAAGLRPSPAFEGRSLLERPRPEAVFAETAYRLFVSETPKRVAVRTADWKLLRDNESKTEELYHVAADPGETHPIQSGHEDVRDRLEALLQRHLERKRPAVGQRDERPPISAAEQEVVKARLRALGYLDEAGE